MRFRILRIGETALYIHVGTLAFALYMLAIGQGKLLLISVVSILLHECAHAASSAAAGYPPKEMEISPLGAVMRLDEDNTLPRAWQGIVLIAGPLMTLVLCAASVWLAQHAWLPLDIARIMFLCNLSLLMMNLLPALPLDGGRLLALLLGIWLKPALVSIIMRGISTVVGLGCIILNIMVSWRTGGWNLSLASAGCFIIYAGSSATVSTALHELRGFMDRKIQLEQRKAMPACCVTALDSLPLRSAVLMLHPRRHTLYCIQSMMGQEGMIVPEERIIDAYLRTPGGRVGDLYQKFRGCT